MFTVYPPAEESTGSDMFTVCGLKHKLLTVFVCDWIVLMSEPEPGSHMQI